jgi:hypothetical protein
MPFLMTLTMLNPHNANESEICHCRGRLRQCCAAWLDDYACWIRSAKSEDLWGFDDQGIQGQCEIRMMQNNLSRVCSSCTKAVHGYTAAWTQFVGDNSEKPIGQMKGFFGAKKVSICHPPPAL